MGRVSAQKRAELEGFWRSHHEGWQASDLNQREYCELHGLPLKRFGNWRAQFRDEETVAKASLLWRRGGGPGHVSGHMSDREIESVSSGLCPLGEISAGRTPQFPNGRQEADRGRGDGARRLDIGGGASLRDRPAAALPLEARAGVTRARSGVPAGDGKRCIRPCRCLVCVPLDPGI